MKYLDEFRTPSWPSGCSTTSTRPPPSRWAMMEVCGGQTHSIIRHGIDQLLPDGIELIHGPGCPVCVTPLEMIDKALEIASRPDVIFCSFGDMLRVPGSEQGPVPGQERGRRRPGRLLAAGRADHRPGEPRPAGGVLRDRLRDHRAAQRDDGLPGQAARHRELQPAGLATCGCRRRSRRSWTSPVCRVQAFLAAGHVCTVMGTEEYPALAETVPGARSWSPASSRSTSSRASGAPSTSSRRAGTSVENAYPRAVHAGGQPGGAGRCSRTSSRSPTASWRGIGMIPQSGWRLSERYREYDAEHRFAVTGIHTEESTICRSGEVLQGLIKPHECAAFGTACTPRNPLGATMVSSEGACAAYYLYRRLRRCRSTGRPER